jgi:hypothetical protein
MPPATSFPLRLSGAGEPGSSFLSSVDSISFYFTVCTSRHQGLEMQSTLHRVVRLALLEVLCFHGYSSIANGINKLELSKDRRGAPTTSNHTPPAWVRQFCNPPPEPSCATMLHDLDSWRIANLLAHGSTRAGKSGCGTRRVSSIPKELSKRTSGWQRLRFEDTDQPVARRKNGFVPWCIFCTNQRNMVRRRPGNYLVVYTCTILLST